MDPLVDLSRQMLPPLLRGARVTLELTVVSAALALPLAFLAGLSRLSRSRVLRAVTTLYVEVFRGTSALVQLFWFFFALPFLGVTLKPFTAGVLALSLNTGAYASEVVRGAVRSIAKEQTEAATALNLTSWQSMRYVVLPQAWIVMLPAFGNSIIELLKVTALVSLVTLQDLSFQAQVFTQSRGHTIEVYALLLVLYFALASPFTALVRRAERRSRWAGYGEGRS